LNRREASIKAEAKQSHTDDSNRGAKSLIHSTAFSRSPVNHSIQTLVEAQQSQTSHRCPTRTKKNRRLPQQKD